MKCYLCDSEVELIPPQGAYYHIVCKNCGEYKISLPALSLLNQNNKFLIAGLVFNHSSQDPYFITSDTFKSLDNPTLQKKIYLLSMYIFNKTRELGIGKSIKDIPLNCCYARNNDELLQFSKLLKELGIIEFDLFENGAGCIIFTNTSIQLAAYSKFEEEINSFEAFKETFMSAKKDIHQINIDGNQGNIAIGSGNYQINNQTEGITESEIIKSLLDKNIQMTTIDQIRDELKELIIEYNKENIEPSKIQNILYKLKTVGGKVILTGLNLLTKPEVIQLIEKVRDLA